MRHAVAYSIVLVSVLILSVFSQSVSAPRPPKAILSVVISEPQDGIEIDETLNFDVSGTVTCTKDDCGIVDSYVEFAVGEGSTDFNPIDSMNLWIVSGPQPQSQVLLKDESYGVTWTLAGRSGVYEIRIRSEGAIAKTVTSESRTIAVKGPPPPPGVFYVTNEYQDPVTGFGTVSGSYMNTLDADGIYEVFSEQKNDQGTKKPTDDTTEFGWIFEFSGLGERTRTTLSMLGRVDFTISDSDTAFDVQFEFSGTWVKILAINNEGYNRVYSIDIPDDVSDHIRIRIVDNDRTIGNKETSLLYLDQIMISNKTIESWQEHFIADLPNGVGRRALEIGDIDNDLENEVVVGLVDFADDKLRYYEYGSGIWSEQVIDNIAGYGIHALTIGDVDNDEYDEIVIGIALDFTEYEVRYYEYESGSWTEHNIANPDVTVFSVAVGDLNNDNSNEVAIGLLGGSELRYYEYDSGAWTEHIIDDTLGESDGIEIADIDHDNLNELVWLGSSSTYEALCYYKYEAGLWDKFIIPCPTGWEMDAGDVDNDGQIEIAWGSYAEPEHEIRVYDYESEVWNEIFASDLSNSEPGIGVYHVSIGDVDNDFQNELVFGLANGDIGYLEYESGEWSEYYISNVDAVVEVVTIGDLDNDGNSELLVGLDATSWELRYYTKEPVESSGIEILNSENNQIASWKNQDNEICEFSPFVVEYYSFDIFVYTINRQ